MFDKIKKWFTGDSTPIPENSGLPEVKETPPVPKAKKPRKPKPAPVELSEKEKATAAGQPYINIIKMDVDPNNVNSGVFEFDWNDKFIINLIKSGYKIKPDDTDSMIVDRWFQIVCRNVALEIYEQQQADPDKRDDIRIVRSRDIGDGRTEVS